MAEMHRKRSRAPLPRYYEAEQKPDFICPVGLTLVRMVIGLQLRRFAHKFFKSASESIDLVLVLYTLYFYVVQNHANASVLNYNAW